MNLYLREIIKDDKNEICKMCDEIRNNDIDNQFEGLTNFKDITEQNYDEFLVNLKKNKDIELEKTHLVNQTTYVLVDNSNHIYGGVNIRHRLNDNLLIHGGHIGMLIRPTERKKGCATIMIGLAIQKCKEHGINDILITCRDNNIGSKKAIEKNNAIYENSITDEKTGLIYRRYWFKNINHTNQFCK